ncbi:hypothetical protein FDP61_12630 [Enterobacter ludwigii]|nr:hypothetical protein AM379_14205 [Enterobacter cloacae complex sp. FDA-CDC-AR_0132]AWC87297.1 hypothetical protein AM410_00500 [Enterobacter cloacae complex sp. FDA-CDC-AR_0164]KAA0523786.1 hypothetical protein F0325_05280 [Enterobacter ludwigii]KAB5478794.1 hypothetical protein F8561_14250 [Enterobacter sp. 198]TYD05917.1 hypothetical protein E4M14_010625 [Enterobacter sp. Z1]
MPGKTHKTTTILQIGDLAGCFTDRFNDILPVVRSKIVDKYNIPLNRNAFLRYSQLEHARYE